MSESIRFSNVLLTFGFVTFDIQRDRKLRFSFSDFREFVYFADQSEASMKILFGASGDPMYGSSKDSNGHYTANLFAATIIDMDTLS